MVYSFWASCPSVSQSLHSSCLAYQEQLQIDYWNFTYGIRLENMWNHIHIHTTHSTHTPTHLHTHTHTHTQGFKMLLCFMIKFFISPACSRVRYRRPIFCPSVRLSTFMLTFNIYVRVSILINYKTKQPSNLAWNISLTSWLCNIGVRFSVCLSIRPSVCQHLCRSSTFMSKLVF